MGEYVEYGFDQQRLIWYVCRPYKLYLVSLSLYYWNSCYVFLSNDIENIIIIIIIINNNNNNNNNNNDNNNR